MVPANQRYTREHEWVRLEGDVAVVGITDYAQGKLGDVVFVQTPAAGDEVKAGEALGTVESVKAASDIYAPVSGRVAEANAALADNPGLLNKDPYGAGFIAKLAGVDAAELSKLMDAAAYEKYIAGLDH
jgi:glycine cleavage system H protein